MAAPLRAEESNGNGSFEVVRRDSRKLAGDRAAGPNLSMQWKDINFRIKDKHIISGVTGTLASSSLTCVLGPSGSGKTTLLNLLAGRQQTRGKGLSFSGTVSVGGQVIDPPRFRRRVAYVMQDDALFATETPRECLQLSALLRLPGVAKQERIQFVESLLQTLHLSKCANTMIGSATVKGVSGGERKRTSVGVELITNPDILFLDEPLSGLDSFAAFTLTKVLKALAESGVPVLCTLHQPSSEIFNMFDSAIVLHDGEVIYQGRSVELVNYASLIGYKCPANFNPADHVMFLIQSESAEAVAKIKLNWRNSHQCKDMETEVETLASAASEAQALELPRAAKRANLCKQFAVLTLREFRGARRNIPALAARFGSSLFIGGIFAWLFAGTGSADFADTADGNCRDPPNFNKNACVVDYQAHYGIVISIAIQSLMAGSQPTLITFPNERPVFLREHAAGQYRVLAYLLAKTLVEMPILAVAQTLQLTVMYFIAGLGGDFFLLVLYAWMLGLAASSIALLIGCAVGTSENAVRVAPLVQVPQMLFSGLFLPVQKIPSSIRWIKTIVPLKYAINLLVSTEFADVVDRWDSCVASKGTLACTAEMPGAGFEHASLEAQDVLGHGMRDLIVLSSLIVVFRLLSTIVLYRKGKFMY